jgi:hypothetical protein
LYREPDPRHSPVRDDRRTLDSSTDNPLAHDPHERLWTPVSPLILIPSLLFFGLFLYGLVRNIVPFALGLYFIRHRQSLGVALCMFFFFEQLLPIARYMADAQVQHLPWASIGRYDSVIHDWNYLFTKLGVALENLSTFSMPPSNEAGVTPESLLSSSDK